MSYKISVSGVSHGMLLGKLLFLVFIKDPLDEIISVTLVYTDDSNIWRFTNSFKDSLGLQEDSMTTGKCAINNGLNISPHEHSTSFDTKHLHVLWKSTHEFSTECDLEPLTTESLYARSNDKGYAAKANSTIHFKRK